MLIAKKDLFPYLLSGLLAFTLCLLILLDRRFPLFASSSSMVPFLFIVFATGLVLARYTNFAAPTAIPGKSTKDLWVPWYRLGLVGGSLTGVIYTATYWAYDWPAPNRVELSERRIMEMCQLPTPVDTALIEPTLPSPLSIILPGVVIGIGVGMLVGLLFPRWRDWLFSLGARWPSLQFLTLPLVSGLVFGVVCGGLLGTWMGPYFFSMNDGRPLMRLSTVSVATFLSIAFYIIFETARYRHSLNKHCYRALTNVLIIGAFITAFVWLIDTQMDLSTSTYCMYYAEWDTVTNTLKPGWKPIAMGVIIGSTIGGITMTLASGYLIVRTILVNNLNSQ